MRCVLLHLKLLMQLQAHRQQPLHWIICKAIRSGRDACMGLIHCSAPQQVRGWAERVLREGWLLWPSDAQEFQHMYELQQRTCKAHQCWRELITYTAQPRQGLPSHGTVGVSDVG